MGWIRISEISWLDSDPEEIIPDPQHWLPDICIPVQIFISVCLCYETYPLACSACRSSRWCRDTCRWSTSRARSSVGRSSVRRSVAHASQARTRTHLTRTHRAVHTPGCTPLQHSSLGYFGRTYIFKILFLTLLSSNNAKQKEEIFLFPFPLKIRTKLIGSISLTFLFYCA